MIVLNLFLASLLALMVLLFPAMVRADTGIIQGVKSSFLISSQASAGSGVTIILVTPIPTPTPTITPSPTPTPTLIVITRIADITVQSEGRAVRLTGAVAKRQPSYGSPPVTRSDWLLADSTGAIWITGTVAPKGIVVVNGIVAVKGGRAYVAMRR